MTSRAERAGGVEAAGKASEGEARHVAVTLIALALLAGCPSPRQAPPPSPPARDAIEDAPLVKRRFFDAIPFAEELELVTAIVPDWTSTTAELRLWVGSPGHWRLALGPWPAVVGVNGTAWGSGEHGDGSPPGRTGPVKREGDGKTPAGMFQLDFAYGYAASARTYLPYRAVDDQWKCVDDPKSQSYNDVLDSRRTDKDWASAEDMRRNDGLYEWVVNVQHNPTDKPGAGSCIFLHVWSGAQSTTVGCTAMAQGDLVRLIEAIDASARYVLLPKAEYDALAATWDLP